MEVKKWKEVPAQRVLEIEEPTASEESIEEMVHRMDRELDEFIVFVADDKIDSTTAPTTTATVSPIIDLSVRQ